jgi:hypothetical protein
MGTALSSVKRARSKGEDPKLPVSKRAGNDTRKGFQDVRRN